MNTRLQVEHPVTELVTGLDLVALQLAVAEGAPLPAAEPPLLHGHAIEVRLYAEDPAHDWQPQSGRLHRFDIPGVTAEFTRAGGAPSGIRLDSGVESGSTVGVHYDPMLAKVIAWAPTRTVAARALAGALAGSAIHGLRTNRDLLVRVLRHPEFLAGDIDTAFFDRHGLSGPDGLARPLADGAAVRLSALAAALAAAASDRAAATVQPRLPGGWRNVVSAPLHRRFTHGDDEIAVAYRVTRGRLDAPELPDVGLVSAAADRVVLTVAGVRHTFTVSSYLAAPGAAAGAALVHVDSALGPVALTATPRFTDPTAVLAAGSLIAPMPGTVLRIAFSVGDAVTAGQPVLWLEAMKMEHRIVAPADGVLAELPVTVGQQVDVGTVLAVVADHSTSPDRASSSDPTSSSEPAGSTPTPDPERAGRPGG